MCIYEMHKHKKLTYSREQETVLLLGTSEKREPKVATPTPACGFHTSKLCRNGSHICYVRTKHYKHVLLLPHCITKHFTTHVCSTFFSFAHLFVTT